MHSVCGKSLELLLPEKAPTLRTISLASGLFLILVEVADAVVSMHELAIISSAIGEGRRIAATPWVAAGSCHQWRTVITAKTTALCRNELGFHPMLCHSNRSCLRRCVFASFACFPGMSFSCRIMPVSGSS